MQTSPRARESAPFPPRGLHPVHSAPERSEVYWLLSVSETCLNKFQKLINRPDISLKNNKILVYLIARIVKLRRQ